MGRPASVVVSPTALLEEWKELLDKRFPLFQVGWLRLPEALEESSCRQAWSRGVPEAFAGSLEACAHWLPHPDLASRDFRALRHQVRLP